MPAAVMQELAQDWHGVGDGPRSKSGAPANVSRSPRASSSLGRAGTFALDTVTVAAIPIAETVNES